MTSKIVVHCNGNYRVPVYKGTAFQDMGTPEYVGPGNNVTKEYALHTLSKGEYIFVGAEEAYNPEEEAKKAALEQASKDKGDSAAEQSLNTPGTKQ